MSAVNKRNYTAIILFYRNEHNARVSKTTKEVECRLASPHLSKNSRVWWVYKFKNWREMPNFLFFICYYGKQIIESSLNCLKLIQNESL